MIKPITKPFAALFALLAGAGLTQAATEMRCSHQYAPSFPVSEVIQDWAKDVERLSEGELKVTIFGADSLIKANDNITAVAKGSVECAFSTNFQWGRTLPVMSILARPFAMPTDHVWEKFHNSELATFLEEKLSEKGVINIAWLYSSGRAVFMAKGKELIAPESFKSVKIRGFNPQFDEGLSALGAIPVTLPGSETYQALSTGVIDAGVTDITSAYSRKFYEVQDTMVSSPVLAATIHGYVNPKFYNRLSDKSKAALAQAAQIASEAAFMKTSEAARSTPDKLSEQGVKIREASDSEMAALAAVMTPAFDKRFLLETGADGARALELLGELSK